MSRIDSNSVYWIVYREQIYHDKFPQSDLWTNDVYPIYSEGELVFKDCVEMVLERIKKDKPSHYVIVSDTNKNEEMKLLHKTFLSNNIIDISSGYDREKIGKQIEWIISEFGMNRMRQNEEIFFTSDTHFFHRNIIQYCNRPWNSGKDSEGNLIITEEDVSRMNEDMISRWNSVVSKNDIVWHLGDFCLGPNQKENIPNLVSRLNGKINLVLGNHDHHSVKFYYEAGFNRVYDRKIIINDFIVLSHAPMEFVKAPFFNCYGHIHDCSTYKTWSKDSCCVCVERHDYKPVSFKTIKKHYDELNPE